MKDPTPIPTSGGSYAAIDGQLVPVGEDGQPLAAPAAEPPAKTARKPLVPPKPRQPRKPAADPAPPVQPPTSSETSPAGDAAPGGEAQPSGETAPAPETTS